MYNEKRGVEGEEVVGEIQVIPRCRIIFKKLIIFQILKIFLLF